jgi:Fe2+ transport system protein FeoA
MLKLIDAPQETPLRIVRIAGGEGMQRRLFALGFHKDDIIELKAVGILRGPLLVRNITSETTAAIGRGIAQKIFVEKADEKE